MKTKKNVKAIARLSMLVSTFLLTLMVVAACQHDEDVELEQSILDKQESVNAKRMGEGWGWDYLRQLLGERWWEMENYNCENYHHLMPARCPMCNTDPCSKCGLYCEGSCNPSGICESCGGQKNDCSCKSECAFCGAPKDNCKCDKSVDSGGGSYGGSGGSGGAEDIFDRYCGGCMKLRSVCQCATPRCFSCLQLDAECTCFKEN